jgi:LMBR1 domain-containing protein 1
VYIYLLLFILIDLYAALLGITFILLPFNYFYGEDRALSYDNDFDLDLSERRLSNRILRSAKQTVKNYSI